MLLSNLVPIVFTAVYGLLVCPWYSYSQTMISEVIPQGKEFLFFSLFSVTGKTSAFIGESSLFNIAASTAHDFWPFPRSICHVCDLRTYEYVQLSLPLLPGGSC